MALLTFGRGLEFPAYLTKKAGLDKKVIKMMRPLFVSGLRPEQFSNMLRELHTLRHAEEHLRYEQQLSRRRKLRTIDFNGDNPPLFSEFGDKKLYNGLVPGPKYYQKVFCDIAETTKNFMDLLLKSIPSLQGSIDASYKVH